MPDHVRGNSHFLHMASGGRVRPASETMAINLALLGQTRTVVRLQLSETTLPPLSVGETAESEPPKGGQPMGVNESLTPGYILPVSAAADKKDSAAAVHVLGWRT